MAAKLGSSEDIYRDQFSNRDVLIGYAGISHELEAQFPDRFNAFCGSFGMVGMVLGVSSVLRLKELDGRVVLQSESAALLGNGGSKSHGLDGIAPGFIPSGVDQNLYHEVRAVSKDE